ncbi:MAG TPA: 30S ribosomal protein S11 [Candidatus Paceibacterota bacterium]|nr:30S ribosomal protein S11 [Candidatus Paceibacterota bacterium]
MGKKRIATQEGQLVDADKRNRATSRAPKKKITVAQLSVEATFNNTKAVVSDMKGNVLFWSSSGSLGFKGAKKGTPFAASKVGEILAEKATAAGIKEVNAVVKGVGSGREPLVRAFIASGIDLLSIKDKTPVPHNGPKPKKPRRV